MTPPAVQSPRTQVVRTAFLLCVLMVAALLSGVSAMAAPFSATCALLGVLPGAPFCQPRALVVSHVVCIGVGVLAALSPNHSVAVAILGAWLAISGMVVTRSLHGPAVAHTVILAFGQQSLVKYPTVALATACAFAAISYLATVKKQQPMPQVSNAGS